MVFTAVLCILFAAFFNAAWTAVSKYSLQDVPADIFTLYMRTGTALFLFPLFLWHFQWETSWTFWLWLTVAGLMETLAIKFQSLGVKQDFYSTFSLVNTTPLFVLMLAPGMVGESVTFMLVIGVVCIALGALFFFSGKVSFCLFGVLGALFFALNNVASKLAMNETDPYFFSFPAVMLGVIAFTPTVVMKKKMEYPRLTGKTWCVLLLTAFFSFLATLLFYMGIGMWDVTRASGLVRINLIFGFLISFFLLKEQENWKRKLAAGLLICLGTVVVSVA